MLLGSGAGEAVPLTGKQTSEDLTKLWERGSSFMLSLMEDEIFIWLSLCGWYKFSGPLTHSDYIPHVEQEGDISNNTVLIFM